MTAPVPEEEQDRDVDPLDATEAPSDEHRSEAPTPEDATDERAGDPQEQAENAGSSLDQPSQ